MREPRDRAAELKTADGRLEIGRSDFCDAFEQDPDRLFSSRECWYCKYGDFGILTEHPTEIGVCKYEEIMKSIPDLSSKWCECPTVQASKKQEEEK